MDPGHFCSMCNFYLADNMDRLQKVLVLTKDQDLTIDLGGQVIITFTIAPISTPIIQKPAIFIAPVIVGTNISSITPNMEQMTTTSADLSVRKPSQSSSHIKRNHYDSLSTPIERGSSKQACLMENIELDIFTLFLLAYFHSSISGTWLLRGICCCHGHSGPNFQLDSNYS